MPVAIERPDGRLVDTLLEAGHPVVPVSPNAIKSWREGEVLSGAKSDPGDAMVIAEYLRLRCHRLRPATPFSAETKALRTVVRTRGDVVEMRVAATNQLAALLDTHWLLAEHGGVRGGWVAGQELQCDRRLDVGENGLGAPRRVLRQALLPRPPQPG